MNKTVDAADRLLQVDPNNLRALAAHRLHQEGPGSAESRRRTALAGRRRSPGPARSGGTKPADMIAADFEKLKKATTPIFHSAIAADDAGKKDYKGAVAEYKTELESVSAGTDHRRSRPDGYLPDGYRLHLDGSQGSVERHLVPRTRCCLRAGAGQERRSMTRPSTGTSAITAGRTVTSRCRLWPRPVSSQLPTTRSFPLLRRRMSWPRSSRKLPTSRASRCPIRNSFSPTARRKTRTSSGLSFRALPPRSLDVVIAATPTQVQLAVSEEAKTGKGCGLHG